MRDDREYVRAFMDRRVGSLDDEPQRQALLRFCRSQWPDKYYSFMCDQLAPRFTTEERAVAFLRSCEIGKPDWGLPVIQFQNADGKMLPTKEWENAPFEAQLLELHDRPFGV